MQNERPVRYYRDAALSHQRSSRIVRGAGGPGIRIHIGSFDRTSGAAEPKSHHTINGFYHAKYDVVSVSITRALHYF